MRFDIGNQPYWKFFKKIDFAILKIIFFISSLLYFGVYFFYNVDQISFDINFEKNGINLFLSFLFCVLSIFLNAYSWKYIVFFPETFPDKPGHLLLSIWTRDLVVFDLAFGFSTSRAFIQVRARLIWSQWGRVIAFFHKVEKLKLSFWRGCRDVCM